MAGDTANAVLSIIAEKVITPVVDAIGRQFGYIFFYKSNIKNLEKKFMQLEQSRDDAETFFNGQRRNNIEITKSSAGWLKNVEEVTMAAKEVVEAKDKSEGWCLNLKNRYVLSKKSTKLAAVIRELQNHAPTRVPTNPALPAGMVRGAWANDAAKDFKTRAEIVDKVMEALKDDKINIIGICGLGGIGKTTILHEVRERARTQKVFDEVAMTTVSQVINVFNIQSDLAGMLGLTDIEKVKNIIARADLLHKRLTNGSTIMVVLDDVWSEIKLEEVGIPVGNDRTKCKVVLASRNESVCTIMGTQKTISVEVLSKEEARHMFKKTAGDWVERENLEKIAEKVADECGGLPIALVTLAGALSNKKRGVWEDALRQLRESNVTRIPEMNIKVYSSIMLSYKFLASQVPEAQPLLLICCQHREDAEIEVEKLARYCLALELFIDVDKVVDARNSTYAVIDHLKSCFLLQAVDVDEKEKDWKCEKVKMHDVVRDVCLSIVSEVKDKVHMHIMAGGYELGTRKVDYPKLKLLMEAPLDGGLLDISFLQQMEQLRVFDLGGQEDEDEDKDGPPLALQVLTNLRMLSFEDTVVSEGIMSLIGSLSRLEILSFWGSEIRSLPHEIGQLSNLKLLDLRCDVEGCPIPSGILPRLNKLEVLCMGSCYLLGAENDIQRGWNGEGYAHITELDSLSNLTTLQIMLEDPRDLLELRRFGFDKLESFLLGGLTRGRDSSTFSLFWKTINMRDFVGMKWVFEAKVQFIVRSTEYLRLKNIKDWTDPLVLEVFVNLNKLVMKNCELLEYVIPERSLGKLQVLSLTDMPAIRCLWVGPTDPLCLVNLREVEITSCKAIENIFSHSAAKCLVQLQTLKVEYCRKLEAIISKGELGTTTTTSGEAEIRKESPNDFIVLFPKLTTLEFSRLPNLGAFYDLKLDDGTVQQSFFNPLVMLPSLKTLEYDCVDQIKQILGGGMLEIPKLAASDWLQNLELVHVRKCNSIETLFDFEGLHVMGEYAPVLTLGEVKDLRLQHLPNLEHICKQIPQGVHAFQNLRKLFVMDCGSLDYLISSSMAHMPVNLEKLDVVRCKSMKEIFKLNDDCGVKKIVFRFLRYVRLVDLKNFSSMCPSDQLEFEFPSLTYLLLQGFNNLKLDDGTLQRLINPLAMSPSLMWLDFREMHQLKQVVGGAGLIELSKLAACNWLQNLKMVRVDTCDSLETVFDFEGLHVIGENVHVQTLCALKELFLIRLPNLEHLCRQVPQGIHAFQNLVELEVDGCDSLGYVISSSIVHMLVNLEKLYVRNCKSMKEVIKVNEDCGVENIVFHSLVIVILQNLEKLSSLCSSDRLSLNFPSLEDLFIDNCPEMKTFCCGHLTAEKLHGVKRSPDDDDDELVWKGDLNETVRHLNARNRVNQMTSDLKEDDVPEEGIADEYAECTNEGTPKKASMPLSVVSSPNASLTPNIVSPSPPVSDINEELADSSSPDLRKVALPPLIEFVPSVSLEKSVNSTDSPVQPKAGKELSDMSLSSPDDDMKTRRILIQGVYVKAEMKTTFEEILTAKPNFLSGLRLKTVGMKTEAVESAIRSLQILRQRTAHTISSEELAYLKDSLDDLESNGLDMAWLERGYQRAILVMKEQKVVSAAAELAMLEREKSEDEAAFEVARAKLEASAARRDAFKSMYGALLQELEAGKELFGGGFDLETNLGDGLLD